MVELPNWCWCVYLCIVPDIEAQTDKAGFELLSAQSARVVLGVRAVGRFRGQQRGHAVHTWGGEGMSCRHVEGWKRVHAEVKNETKEEKSAQTLGQIVQYCAVSEDRVIVRTDLLKNCARCAQLTILCCFNNV